MIGETASGKYVVAEERPDGTLEIYVFEKETLEKTVGRVREEAVKTMLTLRPEHRRLLQAAADAGFSEGWLWLLTLVLKAEEEHGFLSKLLRDLARDLRREAEKIMEEEAERKILSKALKVWSRKRLKLLSLPHYYTT